MKIYFYALRKFDELSFAREYAEKYGIEFDFTTD